MHRAVTVACRVVLAWRHSMMKVNFAADELRLRGYAAIGELV